MLGMINRQDLEKKLIELTIHAENVIHDEYTPQPEKQYYLGKIAAYKEIQTYLTLKTNYNHKTIKNN